MRALSGLALIFTISLSPALFAKEEAFPLCSLVHLKKNIERVEQKSNSYDKFKHCAVSCLLARRCPAFDVMELGIIKELADAVGPGNAEFADLEADHIGIQLGKKLRGSSDKGCFKACEKSFPESSPSGLNCKSNKIP